MNSYTDYYLKQAQSGVGSLYEGSQRARGLGTFFGSLFRSVYPYIKSGFSALTGELLKGGVGVLSDTVRQVPVRESLANRVKIFGNNLTEKAVNKVQTMSGSGIRKRKRKATRAQSVVKRRGSKTKKRKVTRKPVKRLARQKRRTTRKAPRKKKRVCKKKSNSFRDIFS